MPEGNVERFREAVEAVNAGDVETALGAMHPDVEWRTLDMFPDAATYHGADGVLAFFQTWLDTFKGFQLHLEGCAAVGENRVLAELRVSGVGAESGTEVKSPPFFQVVEFRDGLMFRARMFQTESAALEAAGLSG